MNLTLLEYQMYQFPPFNLSSFYSFMQDPIGIPACFSSSNKKHFDDQATVTKSGQSVFISTYKTKMADQCCFISITWCKNLLIHGLLVSVEGPDGENRYSCRVELKPWYFWKKQGSKRFVVDGKELEIYWDLRSAKFNGETEPMCDYYVAVVCAEQVILLDGNLKQNAYRKTGCRPALIDPILVSRKEHIFGKKRFSTRFRFHEKGKLHEVSIECINGNVMEMRIDGDLVVDVKNLQWKFRGNELIHLNQARIEVYWDVHDWLFSPGLRHALFIFKPLMCSSMSSLSPLSNSSTCTTPLSSQSGSCCSLDGVNSTAEFCLFLYAWKVE